MYVVVVVVGGLFNFATGSSTLGDYLDNLLAKKTIHLRLKLKTDNNDNNILKSFISKVLRVINKIHST